MMKEANGKCAECGSDDLILEKGHYECRKCGNVGSFKEWVRAVEAEKKKGK